MAESVSVRVPDACPYRQINSPTGSAHCRLLGELLGGLSSDESLVSADACTACCRSFLPTPDDLNPIVAALVWSQSEIALSRSDVKGDAVLVKRLIAIHDLAEKSLPLVPVDDDDLPLAAVSHQAGGRRCSDEIAKFLPLPDISGRSIENWAVGIATAPRRQPTLDACVNSLRDTGWESPHLFVDGDVDVSTAFQMLPRTIRLPAAGAWKNFYLSLVELLRRSPAADGLMLVQDDALWPAHLPIREYLERIHWPVDGRFVVSPSCSTDYTASTVGWRRFDGVWQYGAVALIFSRQAAEEFVADRVVVGYGPTQTAGIDGIVGEWAARKQIPIFVPTPSLVQHIGDVSTLWRTSRAVGLRRASRFLGDELAPIFPETESR